MGIACAPWAAWKIRTSSSTGATSGQPVRSYPPQPIATGTTYRAGRLVSERSVVLLFVPLDVARHPATILYRALPMLKESAELSLHLAASLEIGAVFAGIRDSSGRVIAQGRLEDLSL